MTRIFTKVIVVNRKKAAFTVIEILISMLILFTAIAFSNIAIKSFNHYKRQSTKHQNFYITALNLKEWMYSLKKFNTMKYEGEMNGIVYSINIKEVIKKRNYSFNQDGTGSNDGNFYITLYRLTMILNRNDKLKEYSFLLTKQRSVYAKK